MLRREVGALGPGRHVLTLDGESRLRQGLYFLRLVEGPRMMSVGVALVR